MRVVGLDLSLTSTGMSDGHVHQAFLTTPDDCVEKRLTDITMHVRQFVVRPHWGLYSPGFVPAWTADLALIEAPAWSRQAQTGHEELSGLRMAVRTMLWRHGIPYALVPPSTLKKYTTGDGRASKAQMVSAVDRRMGTALAAVRIKHGRYDQADALALAAMGYDHIGQPLSPLPAVCPASLDAVEWPDLMSDEK